MKPRFVPCQFDQCANFRNLFVSISNLGKMDGWRLNLAYLTCMSIHRQQQTMDRTISQAMLLVTRKQVK
jgi:hypothetical protein